MRTPRFPVQKDDDWVQPVKRGYLMACCDCGLVHRMNFRVAGEGRGQKVQFQVFRAERHTKALRKRKGIVVR